MYDEKVFNGIAVRISERLNHRFHENIPLFVQGRYFSCKRDFSCKATSTGFARIVGEIVTFSGKCHSDLVLPEKCFCLLFP
jgi:hypothetical protein